MVVVRIIGGVLLGAGAAFGTGYLLGDQVLSLDSDVALILGAIMAVIAGVYSGIAMASRVYKLGFWSIVGYILDVTWSLLNSLAGLLVWIPASLIAGGTFQTPDSDSQRSGTFVYDKNPRGGGFGATTIGTVIAGGWSSHEEVHVWQARFFGPAYMVIYITSFLLNFLAQLPFRRGDLLMNSYYRICFEEWAYWGGSTGTSDINWGGWFGGLMLTLLYCTFIAAIVIGFVVEEPVVWIIGIAGLVLYTIIRAALPRGH